jgi:Major Facilitator Superfamily
MAPNLEESKEIDLSTPASENSPVLEKSSTNSVSSDSPIERVTVEPYDEFAEPIEVLSRISSRAGNVELSKHVTGVSLRTTYTSDPGFEIDFDHDDPENPKNWSVWKSSGILFFVSFSTLAVVLYSTSYTAGIPGIMLSFHISSDTVAVLGITTYLLGLACGSLFLAPLSEMYGRRPVYIIAMALFAILIIPCALAPNLEAILITRFFGAFAGSAMISNAPGTISDITSGLFIQFNTGIRKRYANSQ